MKADNKLASTLRKVTDTEEYLQFNSRRGAALQHKRNLQPNSINEHKIPDTYKAQSNPNWHFPAALLTHSFTFVCHFCGRKELLLISQSNWPICGRR